ncbi:Putative methyltransferase OS=Streptomyces glaucescens OX=1907 GN=SGLAU_01570 PE=4 SV=1 [Streptomyces glaucescens]
MNLLRDEDLAAAFDHASRTYDALVAANPGYHAHLRRSVRRLGCPGTARGCACWISAAAPAPRPPPCAPSCRARTSRPSTPPPGMLERAAAKPWARGVTFVRAPAERLAQAGVRGPFDAVFAAYLFRNVADPDAVLATVRGLVRPGGRLGVHEYTLGGRRVDRAVWTLVCRGVVQPVANVLGDAALYRHLWHSVLEFDTAERFADRLRTAGFDRVRALPLPGWQTGITHTFVARRADAGREEAR